MRKRGSTRFWEMNGRAFQFSFLKCETVVGDRRSDIQNLYYIPAGSSPPNPAELLGSPLFKDMVQALAERFDHILIDAPPIIGFADSVILSSVVDG